MSASAVGLFATGALESLVSNATQNRSQKFRQAFQQLGQDLQSGNLAQAQADLTAIGPNLSSLPSAAPASSSSSSSASQVLNQLSNDLQNGNLSAAQSDYANLQQDLQQAGGQYHHHHAHQSNQNSNISQTWQSFGQLGQALQAGNLNAAQLAYSSLQTELGAFSTSAMGTSGLQTSPSSAGVNISA